MTANNALSVAVLKRRYEAGVDPAQYADFKVFDAVEQIKDWDGDDDACAHETEGPQGIGPSIPSAQAALAQTRFYRGVITRKEFYGAVRIKGQALKTATKKNDAALVDLWTNQLDGIEQTVIKSLEVLSMGAGNAVLGTISSGIATATVTLTVAEDVNTMSLGQRVQLVNNTTLTPTVRGGYGVITALNRSTGTVTLAAAWNATFSGGVDGDSIIYADCAAIAGENTIPVGLRQWLVGGSTPGTFKNLTRNDDPVRLASQTLDMTGLPMAEAVIDLESLIQNQGKTPKLRLIVNPRDMRQVKKTLYGKVAFAGGGGTPTIGFEGANWQGNNGTITVLQSPFCPKGNVFLKDMSSFAFLSAGGLMPMNFGTDRMIVLATDDAAESRIGYYGEYREKAPVRSARGTGWGQ